MVEARHAAQTITNGIHTAISFSYANAAERIAAGPFESYDLYKLAIQTDDNSLWLILETGTSSWTKVTNSGAGSGDVIGPGISIDNSIVRWDGADGYYIQYSNIIIDDSDNITGAGTINGVTITSHAARHENGGSDEISLDNLGTTELNSTLVLKPDGTGGVQWGISSGGGSGSITGPETTTDNAIVRWDGIDGYTIQNSNIIIDDSDNITGAGTINGVTITSHAARHENGGADEISLDNLGTTELNSALVLKPDGLGGVQWSIVTGTGGAGSIIGPETTTDNAIVRWGDTDGYVIQNSGIVIDDSDNISGVNAIDLLTFGTPIHLEGRMFYDYDSHTLAIYNDQPDVIHQVGQENFIRVVNTTGITILDGQCVYINGVQGNRPTVALAIGSSTTTARAIGVATHNILNSEEGFITILGRVTNYDTRNFTAGDSLWVSSSIAGGLTNILPTGTDFVWFMGYALNSTVSGSIFLAPKGPSKISDMHDVNMDGPYDGYYLRGDGTYWNSVQLSVEDLVASDEEQGSILFNNGNNWVQLPPGEDGYILKTQGIGANPIWAENDTTDGYNLPLIFEALKDPSGFETITTSTISIVDGTRTFTIEPVGDSFSFLLRGNLITKTSSESIVFTDTEGLHFFYYDRDGILNTSFLESDFINAIVNGAPVAAIYWDATNNQTIFFAEERHGLMDVRVHLHFHLSFGTQWYSGGSLGNITADSTGNLATDVQFSVSAITYADEDIVFNISHNNPQPLELPAEIPIYYRLGSNGDWRRKTPDTYPLIYSGTAGYIGNRLPYNQDTGTTWQLTEVANNNFVLCHYFASNDINYPIFGIIGQATYANITSARIGAEDEIANLNGTSRLLSQEHTAIGTIIYQTSDSYANIPQARIRSTDTGEDYIDFRGNGISGVGASASDHGSLSGLLDDDHLQYLLANGSRLLTGDLNLGTNDIINVGTVDGRDVSVDGYNLDTHIADESNPHNTSISNLLAGTLASLNSIINDATLDDITGTRTPTAHATSHESGGSDEIDGYQTSLVYTPIGYDVPVNNITGAHIASIDSKLDEILQTLAIIESVRTSVEMEFTTTINVVRSGYMIYDGYDVSVEITAGAGPHVEGGVIDIYFPAGSITGSNTITLTDSLHPAGIDSFDPNYAFRILITATRPNYLLASGRVEPGTDSIPPILQSAIVSNTDPDNLIVTFDGYVVFNNTTGFSLPGNTITGLSGSSAIWTLALGTSVSPDDVLTLSWDNTNVVTDLVGNPLAAGSIGVTNNVSYPELSSAAVDGYDFTMIFNTPVYATGITGLSLNGTDGYFDSVTSGSGTNTVIFALDASADFGETITLDVTLPNDITSVANGTNLQAITGQAVTNNTAVPTIVSAAVDGYEFTMVFDGYVYATGVTGLSLNGTDGYFDSVTSGSGTDTIVFALDAPAVFGETITLDVTLPNDITSVDTGVSLQPITGQAVTNNTADDGYFFWADDFERSNRPLDNGWIELDLAVGEIYNGALLRTDTAGYQIVYNDTDAVMPSDNLVTVTIPHARLSDTFWGIATRFDSTDSTGIRIFVESFPTVTAGNSNGYMSENVTITVTGGVPASYAVVQDHTFAVEVIGSACRILMDGSEYGTFTSTINQGISGLGIGIVGEGNGKDWLAIQAESI